MSNSDFHAHLDQRRRQVEDALAGCLAKADWPDNLRTAVGYSLMAGGKRLRPVLVLLASELCEGDSLAAVPAACAIEMIHTYSLIHDDLPSMDNDDYRRGRLTSHRVFGEALAVLAGDCLLTLAFETLASAPLPADRIASMTRVLACAAGGAGMVGGQVLDLEAERGPFCGGPGPGTENSGRTDANTCCPPESPAVSLPERSAVFAGGRSGFAGSNQNSAPNSANHSMTSRVEELSRIHRMKTGALIAASLELGALAAGATPDHQQRLRKYGQCIGLAFQIADDLLDVTGDAARLGKTPGRDIDLGKLTYPALLGLEQSREKAVALVNDACRALDCFGQRSRWLNDLARFIVERDH